MNNDELKYPRIYTVHSQRGGVGKTSVGIAICGLASILHGKKSLIIDADLTGTSLLDIPGWSDGNIVGCFNDLILATPLEFLKFTSPSSADDKEGHACKKSDFYRAVEGYEGICYIPASPQLNDITRIVPLISQEDILHFFEHRLQDVLKKAVQDGFDVVVVDHGPGLFGFSTASFGMSLGLGNRTGNKLDTLDAIRQSVLVTTSDENDYMALLPSLSKILENDSGLKGFEKARDKVRLIMNKVYLEKGRPDSLFAFQEMLDRTEKLPEERRVHPRLIDILRKSATKTGVGAMGLVKGFNMGNIFSAVKSLSVKTIKEHVEMGNWCKQIGEAVGLWHEEVKIPTGAHVTDRS